MPHATNARHGPLRQIARQGRRHGINIYRPDRDCGAWLARLCQLHSPFLEATRDPLQERVYRYAFCAGWADAAAREVKP